MVFLVQRLPIQAKLGLIVTTVKTAVAGKTLAANVVSLVEAVHRTPTVKRAIAKWAMARVRQT